MKRNQNSKFISYLKSRLLFSLPLVIFFSTGHAFANPVEIVEIYSRSPIENLSPRIEYRYLGNKFQHCKAETVRALGELEWHHNTGEVIRVPRSPAGNWLRFRIVNLGKEPVSRVLSLYWLNVAEAELCSVDSQGNYEGLYSGNETLTLWGSRSLLPHFTINLQPQEDRTYYLFLQTNENINYPIRLLPEVDYQIQIRTRSTILIIACLSILLAVGYSIYCFAYSKKPLFLTLPIHLISIGITLYFLHGREFSSLFGNENNLFRHNYFLFLGITHFTFFLYLSSWANEEAASIQKSPIFWIACFAGIFYPLITLSDFWYEHRIWILILNYGLMFFCFSKSHASLFKFKSYYESAYVGIWSVFLIFSIFKTTFHFEFYPFNWISVYGIIFYFPVFSISSTLLSREIIHRWEIEKSAIKKSHLASIDVKACVEALLRLLKREKIYLTKALKEEDVAKIMGISVHQLSEIINTEFKTSFPALLNQYRVEEAKFLLVEFPSETTANIGDMAGFSSRSAFYLEFKKMTGSNPKMFRRRNLS